MTITANIVPFEQVFGLDGKPLDNGKIYIGTPNQDPQYNQVQVYWDEAGTITAAQPIRTVAGYISYSGAPARIYVNGNYSLKVLTKNDVQVYYVPDYLMVGNQDALTPETGVLKIPDYTTMREYTGAAVLVYVAGCTNDQDGAGGVFAVDESDTTSADNNGTVLVDALGRRWKRQCISITPRMFGAVGDGVADDLLALQKWQDVAFTDKLKAHLSEGVYYCSDRLVIKASIYGDGREISQIVFAAGKGFTTTTNGTTTFYRPSLFDVGFISDKSAYWNAVDAGAAYDSAVTRADVKRLYGARVWKGNKTATPNNICSNDATDRLNGTGFWNKDFGQWMQTDGVAPDITLAGGIAYSDDTCVYVVGGQGTQVKRCLFQGFDAFVTAATYPSTFESNRFSTMKKGVLTISGAYVGGDSGARVTTLNVKNNLFEDCWVGLYGNDLLQSVIDSENIFQPCIVGVYIGSGGAPNTRIADNYFEICHTAIYHAPNLANYGEWSNNFTNSAYVRYLAWLNSGQNIKITNPTSSSQKVQVAAGVSFSDFPADLNMLISTGFFITNGNAIGRGIAKRAIYKITGVGGTSATFQVENVAGAGDLKVNTGSAYYAPSLTLSGSAGIIVPENIIALRIEWLDGSGDIVETFAGNPPYTNNNVFYVKTLSGGSWIDKDLRVNGQVLYVRLTFTESPTGRVAA